MSQRETKVRTQVRPQTGARRALLVTYQWVLAAFIALGVTQIFLAGFGAFKLNGGELGPAAFDPHRNLGYALGMATLLILLLAIGARAGKRAIILSVVLVLLANAGQTVLAMLGEQNPLVGGLHALDGLVIVGIAGFLHSQARAMTN